MAILTIREHLYVDYPGDALESLKSLATFERTGRLRLNQRRTIKYYRPQNNGTRLVLPRGLVGKVRKIMPDAPVRDERLIVRPVQLGFRWELRDYQEAAVAAVVRQGGGVIVSPPGSGKTVMLLSVADRLHQPVLFLVHTLRLVDQTAREARKALTLPRGGLGIIADGRMQIGTHFTVATIQTLAQQPRTLRKLINNFGTLIIDEVHHCPSETAARVISAMPAKFRIGASATIKRDDGLGPMIHALVGSAVVIPRQVLRERGVIIDPTINFVPTHWSPPEDVPFHAAEEARVMDPPRNVLLMKLVRLARSRGQRVLVLVEREKHAIFLAQMLSQAKVSAYAVYGKLAKPMQDQYFKWMEQGKAVVVATKLANEGLDWPALDCLILAAPGRSPTVLEQRTGRIARTADGKTFALVYDLADEGPLYEDQTRARVEKYHEMGYRVRRFRWPTK